MKILSFFFSNSRKSACQYIKKKKGETPRYTGFCRKKPEKNPSHTHT